MKHDYGNGRNYADEVGCRSSIGGGIVKMRDLCKKESEVAKDLSGNENACHLSSGPLGVACLVCGIENYATTSEKCTPGWY
jgi:hypothetical protein